MKAGFYIIEYDKKSYSYQNLEEQYKRLQATHEIVCQQNSEFREAYKKRMQQDLLNGAISDFTYYKRSSSIELAPVATKSIIDKNKISILKHKTSCIDIGLRNPPSTEGEIQYSTKPNMSKIAEENNDQFFDKADLPAHKQNKKAGQITQQIGSTIMLVTNSHSSQHNMSPMESNDNELNNVNDVYDLYPQVHSTDQITPLNTDQFIKIYTQIHNNDCSKGIFNYSLPRNSKTLGKMAAYTRKKDVTNNKSIVLLFDKEVQTNVSSSELQTPNRSEAPLEIPLPKIFMLLDNKNEAKSPTRDEIARQIKAIKKSQSSSKISYESIFINEFESLYKEKKKLDEELKSMRQTIHELTEENEHIMNDPTYKKSQSCRPDDTQVEDKLLLRINIKELKKKPSIEIPIPKKKQKKKYKSEIKKYTEQLLCNYKQNAKKAGMPLKTLLRVISTIYNDLLKKYKVELKQSSVPFVLKDDFCEVVYFYLLNKFGDKNFTMRKYSELIFGGLEQIDNPKIHLFLGFLGMTSDIAPEDINFYLRSLSFFKYSKVGVSIQHANESSLLASEIPYIRALEYIKINLDSTKEEMKRKCEEHRIQDPKKINSAGLIELDLFMAIALDQHHCNIGKTRNGVGDIFRACDFDNSSYIEFFEFYILMKYVEPKRFTYSECKKLFDAYSELAVENNKQISVISINQFAELSQFHKLFSESAQVGYINCKLSDKAIVWFLRENWKGYEEGLMKILDGGNIKMEYIDDVIGTVREKINKDDPKEFRSAVLGALLVHSMCRDLYMDGVVNNVMSDLRSICASECKGSYEMCLAKECKEN